MFAATANVYAPGDSGGIAVTSAADKVTYTKTLFTPPNLVIGAIGLVILLYLTHHLGGGKRRR